MATSFGSAGRIRAAGVTGSWTVSGPTSAFVVARADAMSSSNGGSIETLCICTVESRNRHAVENFVRRAQVSALETGAPLGMLLIDIDNFKQFNDTFGHQTGDHVLRLIALVLKETVRDGDLAARYGGEELVLLMPDTYAEQAQHVVSGICRAIEQLTIAHSASSVAGVILPSACHRASRVCPATGRNEAT